jgi:cytochrome c553
MRGDESGVIALCNADPVPRGALRSARCLFFRMTVVCGAALVAASGIAVAGDAAAGKAKAVKCQACHGLDGISKLPEAPHIAGQPEPYIIKSLRAYRQGARKDEMMSLVAKQLNNQDIEDIAAYYSAIEFSVKVPQ